MKAAMTAMIEPRGPSLVEQAQLVAGMRVQEFQPWKLEGPVELKFEYKPDEKQPAGRTALFRGANVLEAYREWLGK